MNSHVNALGLKNTHFQTVHGTGRRRTIQFSSRYGADWSGVNSRCATGNMPFIKKKFANGIRQLNRNGLLWDNSLNVDGIKTGHTSKAGYNLVASATSVSQDAIDFRRDGRTDL